MCPTVSPSELSLLFCMSSHFLELRSLLLWSFSTCLVKPFLFCAAVLSSVSLGICCLASALSFPWFALVCLQQFYGGWAAAAHYLQPSLGSAVSLGRSAESSFLVFGWCRCEGFGMLEAGTGIWERTSSTERIACLFFQDGWGRLGSACREDAC